MTSHIRSTLLLADPVDVLGDGRTVSVKVISWHRQYQVTDDGRTFYREEFPFGGLTPVVGGVARLQHDPNDVHPGAKYKQGVKLTDRPGEIVGRFSAWRSELDGLYLDLRIDASPEGDFALEQLHLHPDMAISGEFEADEVHPQPGQLVTRSNAVLTGVAFTLNPQHSDARVLAVRSVPVPEQEPPAMSDTPSPPQPVEDPPAPVVPPVPNDDSSGRISPVAAALLTRSVPTPVAAAAPQSFYRSFGEFVHAAAAGEISEEARDMYYRAIDVAGTADMAGLIQVQWTSEIINLYKAMTPTVQAFSRGTLPDKGLTVSQPIVTARPTIAVQTPGAEIESTKATIGTASWTVQTAAGGQGTTIQAILRSDPSYLDALMRLYVEEMAKFVNLTVATGLYAAADDVNSTDLEYVTADAFDELIIDASGLFLDTIGRPAEVVGMSVDLWKAVAKAKDDAGAPLYPSINPMNRHGSMSARSTSGQVVAVDWYVDPSFGGVGDGITGVVGVRDAYKTLLGEVGTMTADVPSTLVRDTAVFQFFAHGKVDATGLIQIANAS
jgi:hypothetical protein